MRRARPKEMRVPGASHIPKNGAIQCRWTGRRRSPLRSRVRRFESYWGRFFEQRFRTPELRRASLTCTSRTWRPTSLPMPARSATHVSSAAFASPRLASARSNTARSPASTSCAPTSPRSAEAMTWLPDSATGAGR